jgi:hypothetical protein
MRGGRSQPKEVSKSTYHAHAPLRVASYDSFVSQQAHQPNNLGISNAQQGHNRVRLSESPEPSCGNKRRRPLQHIATGSGTGRLDEDIEVPVQGDKSRGTHEAGLGENFIGDTYPDRLVSTSNCQLRHIFF